MVIIHGCFNNRKRKHGLLVWCDVMWALLSQYCWQKNHPKHVKWIHKNWNYKEVKKWELGNGKLRRTPYRKNDRDNEKSKLKDLKDHEKMPVEWSKRGLTRSILISSAFTTSIWTISENWTVCHMDFWVNFCFIVLLWSSENWCILNYFFRRCFVWSTCADPHSLPAGWRREGKKDGRVARRGKREHVCSMVHHFPISRLSGGFLVDPAVTLSGQGQRSTKDVETFPQTPRDGRNPAEIYGIIIGGRLEVKLQTIWTHGKAEVGRVREEKRKSRRDKVRKEEDAGARKGRKVANITFFQCFVAPEGRKVGLLKRRVWSHRGQ